MNGMGRADCQTSATLLAFGKIKGYFAVG